jgi:hypothetical protein
MLNIFQIVLPCIKLSCHLNTAPQPKASSHMLAWSSETFHYWICLIFPELDAFPLLKLRHSRFPPLTDNTPSQQWLSGCTTCLQPLLTGTREERTQCHLMATCICSSA